MKKKEWFRVNYLLGFISTISFLLMAFILQFYKGFVPCTLCIFQRAVLGTLSGIFLAGGLFHFNKIGQRVLGALGSGAALIGILFAGRQVWLQHFPVNNQGDCTISLAYLFKIFSFTEALKQIWRGGTECSAPGWEFLRLSMAEWSLLWFILFFILFLLSIRRALL